MREGEIDNQREKKYSEWESNKLHDLFIPLFFLTHLFAPLHLLSFSSILSLSRFFSETSEGEKERERKKEGENEKTHYSSYPCKNCVELVNIFIPSLTLSLFRFLSLSSHSLYFLSLSLFSPSSTVSLWKKMIKI